MGAVSFSWRKLSLKVSLPFFLSSLVFTLASDSDYIRRQKYLSVISFPASYPLQERGLELVGEGLCVLPTVDWDGEGSENVS